MPNLDTQHLTPDEREIAAFQEQLHPTYRHSQIPDLLAKLAEARAEIAELRRERSEDTADWDWLEKKGFATVNDSNVRHGVHSWRISPAGKWTWTAQSISSDFDNARAAIRAARAGEEKSHG